MSAGRFEWEATRFEHHEAGLCCEAHTTSGERWFWTVTHNSSAIEIASGDAPSSSAAKGAARKALAAHLAKAVPS